MTPKRTTRSTPATTTTTTTTFVTDAQLKALIDQGVANALAARALTWWNSHVTTVGHDVVYAMTWESDKVERYVGGLPDMIHGSVVASRPKTMQEAIEMVTELMDKRNNTFAERQAENKWKFDETSKNYQNLQQPAKGKMWHELTLSGLVKRNHMEGDCKSPANANNNQRGTKTVQKPTCYECGNQGHYKSDLPELKNENHGNQAEGTGVHGMVHALGGGETNQDLNNIEDDINA
nr:hypothetical protein [Tanacetum cinerariifolium]